MNTNTNNDELKRWLERAVLIALSAGLGGGSAVWQHGSSDNALQRELDQINQHLEYTDRRVDWLMQHKLSSDTVVHR